MLNSVFKCHFCPYTCIYHNDPKVLDRHFLASSVDPDQTAPARDV